MVLLSLSQVLTILPSTALLHLRNILGTTGRQGEVQILPWLLDLLDLLAIYESFGHGVGSSSLRCVRLGQR